MQHDVIAHHADNLVDPERLHEIPASSNEYAVVRGRWNCDLTRSGVMHESRAHT